MTKASSRKGKTFRYRYRYTCFIDCTHAVDRHNVVIAYARPVGSEIRECRTRFLEMKRMPSRAGTKGRKP